MKKLSFIFSLLLMMSVSLVSMAQGFNRNQKKPNLLVIHTNEQTFRSLSCYDNSWGDLHTPNLDFLADNGARFESFYTNHPLCTPSRASLLTGNYAQKSDAYYNELLLKEGTQTLGHIMQKQGFVTGYSGKFHLAGGILPGFAPPRKFGFTHNRFMFNTFPLKNITITDRGMVQGSGEIGDKTSYTSDFLKDRTIEFIEENKNNTWCYMVSFPDPREPMTCRSPYDTMYKAEDMTVPATFQLPKGATTNWRPHLRVEKGQSATEYLKKHKAQYYGVVKLIDDCVGEMIASLKRNDLLENTVIVFTTDQGEMMGEFSRYDKEIFHDASAKIPFIVYYPTGIQANTVVREVVSNIDFIPTILDVMDIPFDIRDFDGRSAAALLKEDSDKDWKNMAYLSVRNGVAVVTDRFKLIVRSGREPCLIDLKNDPDEYDNVVGKKEFREDVRMLTNNLKNYLEYTNDPNWIDQLPQIFDWRFEQVQTYRPLKYQNAGRNNRRWKTELKDQINKLESTGLETVK